MVKSVSSILVGLISGAAAVLGFAALFVTAWGLPLIVAGLWSTAFVGQRPARSALLVWGAFFVGLLAFGAFVYSGEWERLWRGRG